MPFPDHFYRPPRVMRHDPTQAHITAVCKDCGFIFDAYYGLECPACKRVEEEEGRPSTGIPHVLSREGNVHRWDCPACEWEQKVKPEVDWLEALYGIEDPRT